MKILVPIKRVVDYNVRVRVLKDATGVDLNNVKMSINPFCEIAVEEALRIKEKLDSAEVVAVSIGPQACKEQIRNSLALGADRGIHIISENFPEPLQVAKLLAEIVKRDAPNLVILGKQSIDTDNNQVGQMLAALTQMPQATFASNIEVSGDSITVTREVDSGLQVVKLDLPAVVTTDLRLNEPRFAKLPDIMKAKRKPIEELDAINMGVELTNRTKLLSVRPPAQRTQGVKVSSVKELVSKLRDVEKVI